MQFAVERSSPGEGCSVLDVRGELDVATAPALEAAVEAAVAQAPACLVLDLSATSFLDSTGCRQLARSARAGAAGGVDVVLVCPSSNRTVRRVVDMLDLNALVPVLEASPLPSAET